MKKNLCLYKLYFHYCLSSVQNCADWFHIQFFICSSQNDLHIFPVIYRVRVHNFQAFSVWLKMLIFLLWYLYHKKIISLWITVKIWLFLVVFRNLFHPSNLSTIAVTLHFALANFFKVIDLIFFLHPYCIQKNSSLENKMCGRL